MSSRAELVNRPPQPARDSARTGDSSTIGPKLNARPAIVAQRAASAMLSTARGPARLLKTIPTPAHGPVQRKGHRPATGTTVRYQNLVWTVQASREGDPQIRITRGHNTENIDWETAEFTIIRADDAHDHDLRDNDPGAGTDAYAALDAHARDERIREKFRTARTQALVMIKNLVRPRLQPAQRLLLNALTLDQFEVTRQGLVLIGSGKPTGPAQWELTWIEGERERPRRTWHFTIDADNPLPESAQDPHVGWTVSADEGTEDEVRNTFGHIWLDFVPVMRTVD